MGRPSDDSGCAVQVRQRNRTGCGKPVTAQFIELAHPVRSAMRLLRTQLGEKSRNFVLSRFRCSFFWIVSNH